jgi:hypothetical protein
VVIGGPAEGWRYNEKGIAVGRESGKAALFLDDFVTVLRTFAPHGPGYFNCQIVPREEGLRRIQQLRRGIQRQGPARRGQPSATGRNSCSSSSACKTSRSTASLTIHAWPR